MLRKERRQGLVSKGVRPPSPLLVNGYWLVFIVAGALSVLGALGLPRRQSAAGANDAG